MVAVVVALASTAACSVGGGSVLADPDAPVGVPDDAEQARVVRVVDGDTVILRGSGEGVVPDDEARVRLLEVDSPESVAPDRPVECFGPEASEGLAELLPAGATVWVAPDEELEDPFDRLLLYVWTTDGEFVNRSLVREGLAEAVLYEPNDRYIAEVRAAERAARDEGAGLWGAC